MALFFQKDHAGTIGTFFAENGEVIGSMEDIEIASPTHPMLMKMTKTALLDLLQNLGLRITNANKLTKDRIANRIGQDFDKLKRQAVTVEVETKEEEWGVEGVDWFWKGDANDEPESAEGGGGTVAGEVEEAQSEPETQHNLVKF